MARIPGVEAPRWWQRKWIGEALAIVPPILMAGGTGWGIMLDKTRPHSLAWPAFSAAVWLLLAGGAKTLYAASEDRKEQEEQSPRDLAGCVHVIHRVAQRIVGFSDAEEGRLRVTVHRIVPTKREGAEPTELEQVLPYVGGQGGNPGRRFRVESGIIGLAIRDADVYTGKRESDDYEAYLGELVRDWSYPRPAAERLRRDRFSWMAVPLFSQKREVMGAVYLDSDQREFFDDERVVAVITYACSGIAAYIDERYG